MLSMITTKVSSRGQVVIPKKLREKLHLEEGLTLELIDTREGLLLRPLRRTPPRSWSEGLGVLAHLAMPGQVPSDAEFRAAMLRRAATSHKKRP